MTNVERLYIIVYEMRRELLAARLRAARSLSGQSRLELATALGISPSSLGNYERGTREAPLSVIYGVAQVTDVSLLWLLGEKVPT